MLLLNIEHLTTQVENLEEYGKNTKNVGPIDWRGKCFYLT
jgi:hypothetical protein